MKLILLAIFIYPTFFSIGQTNIAIQNFDAGLPTMTFTNTGGATITGSSILADAPSASTYFTSATTAFRTTNETSILNFSNNTGLLAYISKFFEFRLASFSLGSGGNGADAGDNVIVSVSLDGGATFSQEIQINGNGNAHWHYTSGTGVATAAYDGNNTPSISAPAGGGARTTDGFSTVRINLPNGCTQAQLRITSLNNSANERWAVDDIRLVGTLSTCLIQPTPTTNSSALSASPFCTSANLNWTSGNGSNRIVVMSTTPITASPLNNTNYPSNSTFGSGSTIAPGNFVVFNGTGSAATVTGLTANTSYFVKIFEYNLTVTNCNENYLTTSPASISFTTLNNCSTPQIRSILADACSSQEGLDELVIIENGANPLSLNDIFLSFPSGGNYCNTTCGTNTLGNNPTYINQLNTLAGCSLFTFADPIPAGAIIVVFTGQTPSYTFNYSTQCPSTAQYYAVFCNNASTVGRFSNNDVAGATRTMNATFVGVAESVTYQPFLLTGDGSFVDFDNPGNPTYRNELNCVYPLGVELSNWSGSVNNDASVLLSWSTLSEENASHFEVLSVNPTDYSSEVVGSVFANGNSIEKVDYQFIDLNPTKGVNYYQLNQVDRNGNSKLSSMLAVNISLDEQIINYTSGTLFFSKTLQESDEISIYSLDGKFIGKHIITEKTNSIQQSIASGAFIVKIQKRNGQVNSLRSFASN